MSEHTLDIEKPALSSNRLKEVETDNKLEDHSCRVCLLRSSVDMEFLFDDEQEISLAEQINQCSEVPLITCNDGFAQFICGFCKEMLDVATHFRELCKKSDEEMRTIRPPNDVKTEDTVEEEAEYYLEEVNWMENNDDGPAIEFKSVDSSSTSQNTTKVISKKKMRAIKYRCEHCDQSFTAAKHFKCHMKQHLPPKKKKSYPCVQCKKTFRGKSFLLFHMKSHSNERPFVCEKCGKSFKYKLNLQYHHDRHENIRKFACSWCPFRAVQKSDLKIHERSHTGDKPFGCPKCPQTFSTSSNRLKHIRAMHEKRKDFGCDVCGRFFKGREGVRRHMTVHSGKRFQCQHCSCVYSHLKGLRRHMNELHPDFQTPKTSFFDDQCSTKNRLGEMN